MKIEVKILDKEFYSGYIGFQGGLDDEKDSLLHPRLPRYATQGSAGIDLVCTEDVTLYPGEVKAIHTGLAIWIGSCRGEKQLSVTGSDWADWCDVAGIITPRSGLGTKKGLVLANLVGVIDEDYQGELIVHAWNRNPPVNNYINDDDLERCDEQGYTEVIARNYRDWIELKAGERFAQLVFVPVIKAQWDVVDEFSNCTDRGTGGFGSTDK